VKGLPKFGLLVLLLLLCSFFGCEKQVMEKVTHEQAKAIFDTYAEARNQFKLDMLDQIYHTDVVVHDCSVPEDIKGLDALKRYYSNTHSAFSNINFSADQIFIDGDRIISIWIFRAVSTDTFHTPLGNAPPTGKEVKFSGIAIDRLVDGKFAEEWVYFNVLDPLLQLGFRIVPPQADDAE
jgi:predicted ester cyclase